jgi:hypothetical protein
VPDLERVFALVRHPECTDRSAHVRSVGVSILFHKVVAVDKADRNGHDRRFLTLKCKLSVTDGVCRMVGISKVLVRDEGLICSLREDKIVPLYAVEVT